MKAAARLVAELSGGRTVFRELRSMTPLTLLPKRGAPGVVHLVNSACAPLGGDELDLTVVAGAGTTVRISGVAASLVLPGHRPGASRSTVRLQVGPGAAVEFLPGPTIITARARHEACLVADLAADARLRTREVLVLGREGEPGGRVITTTVVRRERHPVLNQSLDLGDPVLDASPAVLAGRRVLATEFRAGYGDPPEPVAHDWGSLVPLAAGAVLATALAPDAVTARAVLIDLAGSAWV